MAVPIRGDYRKKPNKYGRIEAISPYFEKGYFFVSIKEKDNPHVGRFISQFTTIEKGSRAPDDAPDATEGAIFLLNEETSGHNDTIIIPNKKSHSKYRY